jgi:hypothetical protein
MHVFKPRDAIARGETGHALSLLPHMPCLYVRNNPIIISSFLIDSHSHFAYLYLELISISVSFK